jgi:hypothetical protein
VVLEKDTEDQLNRSVRNAEVLKRVKKERNILHEIKLGNAYNVGTAFYSRLLKER